MTIQMHTPAGRTRIEPDLGSTVFDLEVTTRLDISTRLFDRVAVVASPGALILLDVSGVRAVTPSGVADLLHTARLSRTRGAELRLYGRSAELADAFAALDLTRVCVVYSSREAAIVRRESDSIRMASTATRRGLRGRLSRSTVSS